jgi:hypothetical protein
MSVLPTNLVYYLIAISVIMVIYRKVKDAKKTNSGNRTARTKLQIQSITLRMILHNPLKATEFIVLDLIKELKSVKKEDKQQTEINVYEGKEAIRIMYTLFKKYKEMLSFGATGRAYNYLYESPAITKELVKVGIKGRIITSKKHGEHPMAKIKSIEVRYANYESEATTTLFGDYVMIHIVKDKPIIILIKNKDISDSYKKHFEVLWKSAKSS